MIDVEDGEGLRLRGTRIMAAFGGLDGVRDFCWLAVEIFQCVLYFEWACGPKNAMLLGQRSSKPILPVELCRTSALRVPQSRFEGGIRTRQRERQAKHLFELHFPSL